MAYLATYKKSDFKRLSWGEYVKVADIVLRKVDRYLRKEKIVPDAVVPILRGGAFLGTYLAFKLHLLRIIPVQYKYFYSGKRITLRRMLSIHKDRMLPRRPAFLLVENNHCFGVTAATAARDIKKIFPSACIIYVAEHMDYSYQNVVDAEATFYGRLTNETRKLNRREAHKKRIPYNRLYLFPWEDLEEEWTTVNVKQFPYRDLGGVRSRSTRRVAQLNT